MEAEKVSVRCTTDIVDLAGAMLGSSGLVTSGPHNGTSFIVENIDNGTAKKLADLGCLVIPQDMRRLW